MPLPDSIPVKYSEDDAQFISIRPLVRQTFRPAELIDMIVSVTGKDPQRVQQILRSGTVVFNSYRYWWNAIDSSAAELANILATYPEPDPSCPFRPGNCSEAILESAGTPPQHSVRLPRADARRKRLFRTRSVWDILMSLASRRPPAYGNYSYAYRADFYILPLDAAAAGDLAQQVARYAPRTLRRHLAVLPQVSQIAFLCPRR